MYNKVSTGMNFVEREKEVEKFWKDKDIFRKSIHFFRLAVDECFVYHFLFSEQ